MVVMDDGFIDDDKVGLYRLFLKKEGRAINPRFFNQIEMNDFWQIEASAHFGEIFDKGKLRGRINYTDRYKGENRIVSSVDWFNDDKIIRMTDYYDIYGDLYSRGTYDQKGKMIHRTYYDTEGKEVIVENFTTGDIILNLNDKVKFFHNKLEFLSFAIDYISDKYDNKLYKIYYNSLGIPFLYTLRCKNVTSELFWQEGVRYEIPENMRFILDGKSNTNKIWLQDNDSYEAFKRLSDNNEMLHKLGYVYNFTRNNTYGREVFIFTNSDQIEGLKKLVEGFSDLHFNIAAITEMSGKLLSYAKYENVTLYPNISDKMVKHLYSCCNIYLDINHGTEIRNALKRAFLSNMLIMAFSDTRHRIDYISNQHVFDSLNDLMDFMKNVIYSPTQFDNQLRVQRVWAMKEDEEKYKNNVLMEG
jgi:accessory Sec system glycosyltransferase GtfB